MSDEQTIIKLHAPKAGYINVMMVPNCGYMKLFDHNNKFLVNGSGMTAINKNVAPGDYKLVVIPNQGDCTINVLMPE